MAPDVFWQGIREDLVCENRSEAMEVIATEEQVVLGVRSSQLREVGGVPLRGQIFQVFTLRQGDGRIVRVDEYERRGEALAAAGAEGRGEWR
jgi:hypothetical protein